MRSESLTRTQRARREDIVAAAIAVVHAEGHAAASIDRIAREAGTSKSTVLYHFKAREAIDEAVVRLLYDNGAAYMTEQVMAVDSARLRLRAYLGSNLRFIADNAAHVVAVHRILGANQHLEVDDGVEPLRRLLAAGQEAGEFGSFDAEVMALAIRALVDAASFHFTANPGLDVQHYIDQTVQLFDKATNP
jgi:AcrR family transcriptional regulator